MRWAWCVLLAGCFSRPTLQRDSDAGSGDDDAATDSRIDGRTHPARCAAIDRPGLVAYYSFDEAVSDQVSDGASGNLDGTLDMATLDAGKTNNAVHFSSPSANVRIGTHASVNNLARISVCAWAKLDAMPSMISAIVLDKSQNGALFGWNSYLNRKDTPLGYRVAFYTPFHAYRFGQTAVPIGEWFHMCTTWDGSDGAGGIHVYLDGVVDNPAQELPGDIDTIEGDQSFPLVVGRQSMTNQFSFPGQIDELALYNVELGAADVLAIYDCPTSI